MPNLSNLNAEIGADLIGDDAQPTLRLRNTSTGPGLVSEGFAAVSTASIDKIEVVGGGTGNILAGNATIGIQFALSNPSRASGAFLKINGGAVSLATIKSTTGGVAGTYGARIVLPNGEFGWIPIYPDAAITAAAV